MASKSTLICFLLFLSSTTLGGSNQMIGETEMAQFYAKINEQLQEEVPSGNLIQMTVFVSQESHRHRQSSRKGLSPQAQAYQQLAELIDAIRDHDCSPSALRLLNLNDKALDVGHPLDDENPPMRPIDRLVQELGFAFAKVCRSKVLDFGTAAIFKQRIYDQVNRHLMERLPHEESIEANMAVARELLIDTMGTRGKGALTEALDQIRSLPKASNELSCKDDIYDVMLRNDLATGGSVYRRTGSLRRIDVIVRHFVQRHALVCRPKYLKRFERLMRDKIDAKSINSLAKISFIYFKVRIGDLKLNDRYGSYDELKNDLLQELNIHLLSRERDFSLVKDPIENLRGVHYANIFKDIVKDTEAADCLKKIKDPVSNDKVYDKDKIIVQLNDKLYEPCNLLLDVAEPTLRPLPLDLAAAREKFFGTTKEELRPLVGLYFLLPAYRMCSELIKNELASVKMILDGLESTEGLGKPEFYQDILVPLK